MPIKPRKLKPRAKLKPLDEFSSAEAEASDVEKPTEVPDGPELLRICGLERRDIPDPDGEDAQRLAEFLTRTLGKKAPEHLYPGPLMGTQALALREGKVNGGGWFPIVVGGGKMLTCYLMAALHLRAGFERVLYVVPGANVDDVEHEFPLYQQSWHGPSLKQISVQSYERLSHKNSAEAVDTEGKIINISLLDRLRPQVIIFDESHNLANPSSACVRLVRYYMLKNPDTRVFAFSGTPFLESINDAAEVMEWCLKERSPLPRRKFFVERHCWGGYLDAKSGAFGRMGLGALRELALEFDVHINIWNDDDSEHEDTLHVMRRVVAQRILETPGVIGTQDLPLDVPLTMEPWYPLFEDPEVSDAYEAIVRDEELPDGTKLADLLTQARFLTSVGLTFWSKWVPAPAAEWVLARNDWSKWCRRALKYNKNKISSEAQLKAALGRGLYKSGHAVLAAWNQRNQEYREATGKLEPPSVPQWLGHGSEVVESVRAWVKEHQGLVWVSSIGLGEKLAEELKLPYYGAGGGLDVKTGLNILKHPGGPAIASIDACGTGKNLQRLWSTNLWLTTPSEQSLARTHRRGQKAAVVRNFIYLGCYRHLESFERARDKKAGFQEDMMLSPQKLRYAESTLPTTWELTRRVGARWQPDD